MITIEQFIVIAYRMFMVTTREVLHVHDTNSTAHDADSTAHHAYPLIISPVNLGQVSNKISQHCA